MSVYRRSIGIVLLVVSTYGIAFSFPLFVVGAFVGWHIVFGALIHLIVGLLALFRFILFCPDTTSKRDD